MTSPLHFVDPSTVRIRSSREIIRVSAKLLAHAESVLGHLPKNVLNVIRVCNQMHI